MQIATLDVFPRHVLKGIDVQRAFIASRLIIAAERLRLFRVLHGRSMTAQAIASKIKISGLYAGSFLQALVALGLLRKVNDTYRNTQLTEKYFIRERSIYWTRQYSKECVEAYEALTVLERALAAGKTSQAIRGHKTPDYVECMKRDHRQAKDFTQMLFHLHQDDAEALADSLDLSSYHSVLDVAGGSSVMSIALAKKNPHLHGCILDIAPVCKVAAGNIRRAGLARRISTCPGDIRKPWPPGYDVVLMCDIGEVSSQLLTMAHRYLPAGGLIVLVDRYLSDDGTKPLDRVLDSFVSSSFPMATRSEMANSVRSSGFRSVKSRNVYQDLWSIAGIKPGRHEPQSRANREPKVR